MSDDRPEVIRSAPRTGTTWFTTLSKEPHMLSSIGPMELIVVLVIALIVLGPKRLPDAGRSLGPGLREFKGAISGGDDRDEDARAERDLA
jgi:sec-independent protein translocase protein TatA